MTSLPVFRRRSHVPVGKEGPRGCGTTAWKLDAERPVPRNHTPRTTGDHSGPTESDWDSTDCLLRTSSNGPSRRGGKRKSTRERRLFRLPRGRVGARALFCTGIAKNLFSESTPFGGPTAGMSSSRRDLTIHVEATYLPRAPRFRVSRPDPDAFRTRNAKRDYFVLRTYVTFVCGC